MIAILTLCGFILFIAGRTYECGKRHEAGQADWARSLRAQLLLAAITPPPPPHAGPNVFAFPLTRRAAQ